MKKLILVLLCIGFLSIAGSAQATPVSYEGQLFNGVTAYGTVDSGRYDFWYFSGVAGDIVDITHNRTDSVLDPVVELWLGYGDSLITLTGDDDSGSDTPDGPFWNALINDYVLPSTGWYTVGARDYWGATGPYALTVIGSGNNASIGGNPVPEPMTMLLFGPALLGLVGLKKRKA